MSDFPAAGVMTGPTPPGYGGASGAVNTPAPAFTQSARHEQRAAEQEQRTYDRWTTTGKADAAVTHATGGCREGGAGSFGVAVTAPERSADAAKPTLCKPYWRRSPFWAWT